MADAYAAAIAAVSAAAATLRRSGPLPEGGRDARSARCCRAVDGGVVKRLGIRLSVGGFPPIFTPAELPATSTLTT